MDKKMREQLVLDALESAIWRESLKSALLSILIEDLNLLVKDIKEIDKHGIVASMSKPDNPYDNAMIESFNKSLKTEILDIKNILDIREDAKKAISSGSAFLICIIVTTPHQVIY